MNHHLAVVLTLMAVVSTLAGCSIPSPKPPAESDAISGRVALSETAFKRHYLPDNWANDSRQRLTSFSGSVGSNVAQTGFYSAEEHFVLSQSTAISN